MADNDVGVLLSIISRVEREIVLKETELRQLKLKLTYLKERIHESAWSITGESSQV